MTSSNNDFDYFSETFAQNGGSRTRQHLRWQFPGPAGRLMVDVAQGRPEEHFYAAIYAAFGSHFTCKGEVIDGLQSLDTLTSKDYRGRGLFVGLASSLYERASNEGFSFVYGFPNGKSVHGFSRHLGWKSLDPVPFLMRPLRTRYFASRLSKRLSSLPDVRIGVPKVKRAGGLAITDLEHFDAEHEEIWGRQRSHYVALDRSAEYLNWRLMERPATKYTTLELRDGQKVLGWTSFRVEDKHGGRVGYVMDLLTDFPGGRGERYLLRETLQRMASQGADLALALNFTHSANHRSFRREGFLPLPERIRPIELHMGVRSFDATYEALLENRRNWYVSYLDSDTV